jgi:hypothetical protein
MKPKVELINPDEVMYETHPESTIVQMLWIAPAVFIIALVIIHVVVLAN